MISARSFIFGSLETGAVAGSVVVCPDAQYATVLWTGAERIERRFLSPDEWRTIELELRDQMQPGPLPSTLQIASSLAGNRRTELSIQCVAGLDVAATVDGCRAGARRASER